MLSQLINNGYGNDQDFNCAEKILYGADQVYRMNLNKSALKMSAGFGGGMGIEITCGALTAAVMVLSNLFVKQNAHESGKIKHLTQEFFSAYRREMGSIDCAPLKFNHRTEEFKCHNVIVKAAEILDQIVERELKNK